jgi:protein-S-isoprenylcysteine O-methyltransferase Ste14
LLTPDRVILILGCVALVAAVPLAVQGFQRRRTGDRYEQSFWIQRAPQLAVLANAVILERAFSSVGPIGLFSHLPPSFAVVVSWLGVLLYASGLTFVVGGWYSLGANFSLDAELVRNQTLTQGGFYRFVLHPAYSGVAQALLGAGLASGSLLSLLFTCIIVAPLGLRRARYEEQLLIRRFGDQYQRYATSIGWRRIVPRFIPLGF